MEGKLALQEHMQLGDVFYKSGLFADLKSAAQAIVKIQAGAELGIPPFAAMSGISIIQGKPALGASLIAGLIKSSHKYDYRVTKHDATGCTIEFYEGEAKLGESSFTADDAKRAGLLGKDIWTKYPRNMLFSRAMSNGARWYTPDLFTGPIYTPEELDGTALEAEYRVVEGPAPEPTPEPQKVDVLAIRELVQAEAKRRDNGTAEPASDQQKTLIRMFIPEATGRKSGPDADQDRHLFLEYLTGNKSSTEITRGYAGAILDQLVDKGNITTDAKGKPLYHISADGKRIVNAVIAEAMRGQGQLELAEVTELAAELGGVVAK